jgi:hypothetical protein
MTMKEIKGELIGLMKISKSYIGGEKKYYAILEKEGTREDMNLFKGLEGYLFSKFPKDNIPKEIEVGGKIYTEHSDGFHGDGNKGVLMR